MRVSTMKRSLRRAAIGFAAVAMLLEGVATAAAANYAYMSCNDLWYARNAIYAEAGYCFKTARARAVFGPGCFPPYGQLTSWQQDQVNQILYWERRRGCR
jgi:YARHG domain